MELTTSTNNLISLFKNFHQDWYLSYIYASRKIISILHIEMELKFSWCYLRSAPYSIPTILSVILIRPIFGYLIVSTFLIFLATHKQEKMNPYYMNLNKLSIRKTSLSMVNNLKNFCRIYLSMFEPYALSIYAKLEI